MRGQLAFNFTTPGEAAILEHNRRTLGYACGDPDCSLNTEEADKLSWEGGALAGAFKAVARPPIEKLPPRIRNPEEAAKARPDYGTIREPDPMAQVDAIPPPMDTLGAMIQWEEDQLDAEGTLKLFSRLVETGEVWTLQGAYGRQARSLIDAGFLDPVHGAITEKGQEVIVALPI